MPGSMSSSPCGHAKPRAKSRSAPQLTAIASRPGNAPAVGLPHWGSIHTATQSTMGSPGPCPHMPGLLSSDHQKFQVKFAFTALSCKWPASSPEYEAPSFARAQAQIEPRFEESRIACQRHTADRKAGTNALERHPSPRALSIANRKMILGCSHSERR